MKTSDLAPKLLLSLKQNTWQLEQFRNKGTEVRKISKHIKHNCTSDWNALFLARLAQ
jgi:hypothetical protein